MSCGACSGPARAARGVRLMRRAVALVTILLLSIAVPSGARGFATTRSSGASVGGSPHVPRRPSIQAGQLDTTFSGDGIDIYMGGTQSRGRGIAVQADGKIVVAGEYGEVNMEYAVLRYLGNGTLDPAFGTGGLA